MRYLNFLYPALLTTTFIDGALAIRADSKIKLSKVQSLTLRSGLQTSHRRVPAMPQLNCIGGSAQGLYDVDVMRCKNAGFDYNEEDVQWTCTASLPEEFKLGSTEVICEGYDSSDDPFVLKGSCGVEYRLVLTSKGEEKYPGKRPSHGDDEGVRYPQTMGEKIASALFWIMFIGIALWIVYSAFSGWATRRGAAGAGGSRPGWGGGGGGGGWGGGGEPDDNDPPPPYEDQARKPRPSYGATEGWRPGFWSGALGGAAAGAAGYAAGRAGNRGSQDSGWGYNNGEGSSRSSSGSSSSPSYSSTRHESTGFGSTSRR